MTVSILRWKGGSGGDMLLYIKSLSHPGSVVNAVYQQVADSGKTNIDYSNVNFSDPREIDKMSRCASRDLNPGQKLFPILGISVYLDS